MIDMCTLFSILPSGLRIMNAAPIIFVVDDDASMRRSLVRLLRSGGLESKSFASAQDFLEEPLPDRPACLLLDIRMPGLGGLELQEELQKSHPSLAIVFLTGHGDVPMTARAMKAGAVDFLQKPISPYDLMDAVQRALERGRHAREMELERATLAERFSRLTGREREVLELVVRGLPNKQVADRLGTVEKTVKVHRARVMEKMRAKSLPDLVRMAERLGMAVGGA